MDSAFVARDIVSIKDLNREELQFILETAAAMKQANPGQILHGQVIASCFFEPSTRTRLSFEAATQRLGGTTIGFSDQKISSSAKGESLWDAAKVIGQYANALVIRHPLEGAARVAADATDKPVINAGDGANQHPTQTLLDLFTIQECQGRLDDLEIALMGDLLHGRTVHSLAQALTHFNARLYFIAPRQLEMPAPICDELRQQGVRFSFHQSLEEVVDRLDILYLTRVQQERFTGEFDRYNVNLASLAGAKESLRILHPLPRVDELATEVDQTPFAYYFEQAQNGLYVRQALLSLVLGRMPAYA